MAENEDAFAVEARDLAILSRSQEQLVERHKSRPPAYHSLADANATDDEATPLLSGKSPAGRDTSSTPADDFTKPWVAFEALPWYKRPSVSPKSLITCARTAADLNADLLPTTCLLPPLSRLGGNYRSQDISHPEFDLSRLSFRSSCHRSELPHTAYHSRRSK
jgi:hypothetical protein